MTAAPLLHSSPNASAWVQRWSHLVAPGGAVLDVACGQGRHLRWFSGLGHPVVGVDSSTEALAAVGLGDDNCQTLAADIENGPWPLAGRQFAGVVVTNYLWRALWPDLLASLAPGGVLLYETFAQGNETVGKPSRPDFLLRPGELLDVCRDLRVVAFEDGFESPTEASSARFVQCIAAVKPLPNATEPPRYALR